MTGIQFFNMLNQVVLTKDYSALASILSVASEIHKTVLCISDSMQRESSRLLSITHHQRLW